MLQGITSSCQAGDCLKMRGGHCCPHSCSEHLSTAELSSMECSAKGKHKTTRWWALVSLRVRKKILDYRLWSKVVNPPSLSSTVPYIFSLFFPSFLPHPPFACSLPPSFPPSFLPLLICMQPVGWAKPSLERNSLTF